MGHGPLFPLGVVDPHQLPRAEVPPFCPHIIVAFLPHSDTKLPIVGKSVYGLKAILQSTGILRTWGIGQGVRRPTKRQLCRGAKLPPQHEEGWCAGCGLLHRRAARHKHQGKMVVPIPLVF